jgi:superfamily II DNA or RNA helicase
MKRVLALIVLSVALVGCGDTEPRSESESEKVSRALGGTEDDIAGVIVDVEQPQPARFAPPAPDDLGDQVSAGLLRSALRIGFRSSAGPFRSLASLAVEPRPYQLVPLLMAMRHDTVRMLIADDVGIGKTIEAALIAAELLASGDARGLSVLCSPALAEQWQGELRTKFGMDAELVLPSTATRLERTRIGAESIFERYPFTVVSTDFIKSPRRRFEFLRTCPDLVIVDEAHTCVADGTARGRARMQRYELVRDLADDAQRHLLLVTATPHSGKDEAFRNLLGLVDPELAEIDLDQRQGRERLARHFVQRRRQDIRRYLDEETPFPRDRHTKEVPYTLTPEYKALFDRVLDYARESVKDASDGSVRQRVRWWSALALLRALASSPRAAAQTLRTRASTAEATSLQEADELGRAVILDHSDDEAIESVDTTPGADPDAEQADTGPRRRLLALAREAETMEGKADAKLKAITDVVKQQLADGYDPIVFCRFIDTAEYVGEHLAAALGKTATVEVVTGTLPPAERTVRIDSLAQAEGRHVLVATDCLSEGVNLQDAFQAVVHYDLAWNPTRHEQREGRVDRFGQRYPVVRAVTLYGRDNQIDGIVLDVLLRKHEAIRKATGVSVPVPDESNTVIEAVMEGLLLRQRDPEQLAFDGLVMEKQETLYTEWESSAERERQSLTKFAQAGIHPEEVAREVAEIRSALGTRDEVSGFVREALAGLRATITSTDDGFAASTGTLPLGLRESLPPAHRDPLPFHSDLPTPRGEAVLTRTDPHVEAVARYVLDAALDPQMAAELRPARRCGVVRTHAVDVRTTLLLVRYRFHLTLPSRTGDRTLVAEDARLVAYRGAPASPEWLDERATRSLTDATADANVAPDQAHDFIDRALAGLDAVALHLEESGDMFADDLRESHRRVRAVTGEVRRGLTVTAQKPADVLGVYVYVPVTGGAR